MDGHERSLKADYVIVGAGAVGLAFLDVMLDYTDADFVLLDRRAEPGGHWRDAYPFVQLHNVSALYGVNSRPLGGEGLLAGGRDAGHMERARLGEIIGYYDAFFREKALGSGRVTWLAEHEYLGAGAARSLRDGGTVRLAARRRIVDATFTATSVPSVDGPGFPAAPGVRLIDPAGLAATEIGESGCTLIGAGKTGMDCVVHLLDRGVDPDAIVWVRPRDPWLLNRHYLQPHKSLISRALEGFAAEMESAAAARSVAHFFELCEAAGLMLRLDPATRPTMFRCAIAADWEIEQCRRVRRVIRMGHVRALEPERMILDEGEVAHPRGQIFVHACADGVPRKPVAPIFAHAQLTLQFVRRCAPMFAAALIARVEALGLSEEESNELCQPVPMVDAPAHWLEAHLVEARNRRLWGQVPALREWLEGARLDGYAALLASALQSPTPEEAALFARWRSAQRDGYARMAELLASEAAAYC